jgi:hypothetical protein
MQLSSQVRFTLRSLPPFIKSRCNLLDRLLYTLWAILHKVAKRNMLINMHVGENYVRNCYHSFHAKIARLTERVGLRIGCSLLKA